MPKKSLKLILLLSISLLLITLLILKQYSTKLKKLTNLITDSNDQITKIDFLNQDLIRFKTEPSKLCKNSANLYLFAYVFISVNSFERRQAIRHTWANRDLFPQLRLSFILGLSKEKQINELVSKESELYGDIIQGDFIDSYRNLSYKSITAWKWIAENCGNAKFVLKIDDDVLPHTFNLFKYLNEIESKKFHKTFHCFAWYNAVVIRDKSSKFYVSLDEYNKTNFDTYCSGVAYLMTNDLFKQLYAEAKKNSIFWIDDIYVGMIGKLAQVNYNQISQLYVEFSGKENFSNMNTYYLFVQNVETNKDFQIVWNLINKKF